MPALLRMGKLPPLPDTAHEPPTKPINLDALGGAWLAWAARPGAGLPRQRDRCRGVAHTS